MENLSVPVSPGELIDKLTILALKSKNMEDAAKLTNVQYEKDVLDAVVAEHISIDDHLKRLWDDLYSINAALWKIEDDIRICEREGDFGDAFIQLARSVYVTNDKRADVKKAINLHLGSAIIEEKSYEDHGGA